VFLKMIFSEDYVKGGETEFTPLLTKIKGLKPDVLGLGSWVPPRFRLWSSRCLSSA
jgi:hypothetical protein